MSSIEALQAENSKLRKEVKALKEKLQQQAQDNAKLTAMLLERPLSNSDQETEHHAIQTSPRVGVLSKLKHALKKPKQLNRNALPESDAELLRQSDWFDTAWYLEVYPDVAKSGMDPVLHYLLHGGQEGRDPSARFNSRWYLKFHSDLDAAKVNPLVHYLRQGIAEQRAIQPSDKKVHESN